MDCNMDVMSTPDVSPFVIRNKHTERLKFNFNHGPYSPTPTTPNVNFFQNDDFIASLNSPNLSPIKESQKNLIR